MQEDLGLTVDKKKYMIGLISRLTDQKGLDLINFVIDRIVDDFTQLVVIGTGEGQYENMFRYYAWKISGRVLQISVTPMTWHISYMHLPMPS